MNQAPENPPVNQFEEEGRRAVAAAKKLKRRVVLGIVLAVVFVAVSIPLLTLLDKAEDDGGATNVKPSKPSSVIFYTPDYDRTVDIRTDSSYLALNRAVRLKRGQHTTVITEDDLATLSPAVGVLYEMIEAVISGDADTYNALFSDRYYTEEGGEPEDPFTMQRIYDIVIEEIREQSVTSAADGKYTEYIYSVEYKINRNDGTYRVDIGHDASRPQYFMLTDREGDVEIDRLMYLVN